VANASLGLPDLAVTTLADVRTDAERIVSATTLPLLVDADTGFGGPLMIRRAVRELIRTGVAGMHLEDQVADKRCGHRPGKQLVGVDEMVARIKTAVDARTDDRFVIMARTDAFAVEGLDRAIERAVQYCQAGADMIFAEALTTPAEYRHFTKSVPVPVLANVTEFGRTPLLTVSELKEAGIALALYPLSAFRAMSAAALRVFQAIRAEGGQQSVLSLMQTREELYRFLDYERQEADQRAGQSNIGGEEK
jgi:methylisocitrate lyase